MAPAAAVYSIERSEAPPDEYSEDEDDAAESEEDGPGGVDGEKEEPDRGLRENMYLKRHITQEHGKIMEHLVVNMYVSHKLVRCG